MNYLLGGSKKELRYSERSEKMKLSGKNSKNELNDMASKEKTLNNQAQMELVQLECEFDEVLIRANAECMDV